MLHNVSSKNALIKDDLEKGRRVVDTMLRKEFLYRAGIHAAAALLLVLMVVLIIMNIVKSLGG